MATTLTGATVNSTYDALIKIGDNSPVSGTLKVLSDGLGNDLPVQISTSTMKMTGTLDVTTGVLTVATPTSNTHAASKLYVDTQVGNEESARITADNNLQSQITTVSTLATDLSNGVGNVTAFNSLVGSITLTNGGGIALSTAGNTITITSTVQNVTGTAPITVSGTTTKTVAISPASASSAGSMSSAHFNKLEGIAAGAEVNVQANWTETNTSSDAFIQNKPTIVSSVVGTSPIAVSTAAGTATVSIPPASAGTAGSMSIGDFNKLLGIQPGAEQNVQSNWTETNTSSNAFILNKPTLSTVATSGSYNDLSNLPSIPAAYTDSDVDNHLNTATATTGQILSWTGSDYDWITDGGGGGVTSLEGLTGAIDLIAGSGISLATGSGTITITNTGGGGAVALDDLTDVTITNLIDHESLVYDEATLQWINGAPKALDLPVYSATAINKGKLVKAVGAVGDKISIALFDLDVDDPKFLLGVTVDNIVLGGTGYVKTYGELRGISTDLYALGTVLYASGTPGEFSSTAGNPEIPIAIVTRSQANTGRIFIRSWVPGVIHSFDKIAATGQPVIVANSDASTLNIASSDGVTLTSDAGTDTLTIGFNKIGTLSEGAYLYWDTATGKIQSDSNVAVSQISSEVTFDYAVVMNQPVNIGNTLQAGDTILLSQSIYLGASGSAGTYGYGAVLMKNIFTGTGLSLGHIYSINSSGAAVLAINNTSTAEDMLVVSVDSNAANGVLVQGIVRLVTSLSGASKGQKVYLSNSSGGVTVTPPTASGSRVRILGYVVDPANNKIYFNPSNDYLTLA